MTKVNPVRVGHSRSLLAGGLGVFASLLAIGWALFGYNLSSTVNLASDQSENLMLLQFSVAFIVLIGSGLMLARYTRLGGAINILGGLATFGIGVLYARVLEQSARTASLQAIPLRFSQVYTAPLVIPVDRLVATLLVVPVFPIATLLVISGLGALATYRTHRPHPIPVSTQQQVSVQTTNK
ncbi:hypothetical protein E6H28_05840 [Candidatus Bathyarchaeota archaeon]|nr:MAG: hypothetical protein E6H28_05840 [Candidatus Bathyarchaeota archaeon]TMI53677.1 MAG: hypothetical protein E6H13_02965 [Candidatus Bathyarchaeota archaeon]